MQGSPEDPGITPRAFKHLFASLKAIHAANPRETLMVRCSYLEVYNETIRDLLVVPEDKGGPAQPKGGLQVKEDVRASRFFVKDLTDMVCSCHSS